MAAASRRLSPASGSTARAAAAAAGDDAVRITESDGSVLVDILVQPRASRAGIGPVVGDRLRVAVTAPPVDGEANTAVVRTLARAFGVHRRAVSIASGTTGRRKSVRIEGVTLARAREVIGS